MTPIKYDIRISDEQRRILLNALLRESRTSGSPKVPESYIEEVELLYGMLKDGLECLADPEGRYDAPGNTLNDFTA
jgi:hypothetical protein